MAVQWLEVLPEVARVLWTHAFFGILLVDLSEVGEILLVNPMVEAIFGYHRSELVGQPVECLLPAGVRAQHIQHRKRYNQLPVNRHMGVGLKVVAQHKDGHHFSVLVTLTPVILTTQRLVLVTVWPKAEDDHG